jgi:hypothetical protein
VACNSFTFSAQFFWAEVLGLQNTYDGGPVGLLNDKHALPVRPRNAAPTGVTTNPAELTRVGGTGNRTGACLNPASSGRANNVAPCFFKGTVPFPATTQVFTLAVSSPYMGGNLTPNLAFIYDMSGSWLVQPGVNWTFWDPWRMQIRYNWIDGRYTGVGLFKTKDSVWLELQYLLY